MSDQFGRDSSLTRAGIGFGVAASPLNAVKLDLAVIMICGLLLLLADGFLAAPESVRVGLLLAYGLAGMSWLIARTRRVVKALKRDPDGT